MALPPTDAEEAPYLAERVRAAVEGCPFVPDGGTALRCTIGTGVALFPDDARDMAGSIKRAAAAVYRAKRTRNAVAIARSRRRRSGHPPPDGRDRSRRSERRSRNGGYEGAARQR